MTGNFPRSLGLLLALSACSTGPDVEYEPLTDAEIAELSREKPSSPGELGKVQSRDTLFVTLDVNLRRWREVVSSGELKQQYTLPSLERALKRHVYLNFETVLHELEAGDPHYRPVAAAALGFSVRPAEGEPDYDPRMPPVHARAIEPLVRCIENGSDDLARNALLSLWVIGSPDTPIDLLLEVLSSHHDDEVRSNAALVLARVLRPDDSGQALSVLLAALQDPASKVRLHALTALGVLEDKDAYGELIGILTGNDMPLIRANAARQLGSLGDLRAVPFLVGGLQVARVGPQCRRSLIELTGQDLGPKSEDWVAWLRRWEAERLRRP